VVAPAGRGRERRPALRLRQIGGDRLDPGSGKRLERLCGEVARDDVGAAPVQQLGDGAADASGRARDRGPGAREVERVGDRLLLSDPIPG